MRIVFGLDLTPSLEAGVYHLNPSLLLRTLENLLGRSGFSEDHAYLRIEHYRQALAKYLEQNPQAFFQASFEQDPFGVARDLLQKRDDLLLNGWLPGPHQPTRLAQLSAVELLLEGLPSGHAERQLALEETLREQPHLISEIRHVEPLHLLPPPIRQLLLLIGQTAQKPFVPEQLDPPLPQADPATDLGLFQKALSESGQPQATPSADGSLLVIRARRASDLAPWLAQLFRHNPAYRPWLLLPDGSRMLDQALTMEGLPSLGLASTSLARPTLQLLKLIPTFLWEPINPYKVLEFLSLALKPFPDDLGKILARQIARSPGVASESWNRAVNAYFARLRDTRPAMLVAARTQYNRWFEQARFPLHAPAPVEAILEIYRFLYQWARTAWQESGESLSSLRILAEQTKRLTELLQTLPEKELSSLELELIVRALFQPAPVTFNPQELGSLPYVQQPGALTHHPEQLVWWNFIQSEPLYFFSPWYPEEIRFFEENQIETDTPARQNQLRVWQRRQPFLRATRQILLCLPDSADGANTAPHPMLGDIESTFDSMQSLEFYIDRPEDRQRLERFFEQPLWESRATAPRPRPRPFFQTTPIRLRERESYSSLQSLQYYPYQWVFQHHLRLRTSPILSVSDGDNLYGNLAHRLFEILFQEPDFLQWPVEQLDAWVEQTLPELFHREGSVLLLYGREPERAAMLRQLKYAARTLTDLLRTNSWILEASEKELTGQIAGIPIAGIVDILLRRGDEWAILDLKWSGLRLREEWIRNEEDLQLALYAGILREQTGRWPHTAYFIIRSARLLARANQAFRQVAPLAPQADPAETAARIWSRMEKTLLWRMQQLSAGLVEVRCADTAEELARIYENSPNPPNWMEMLELPTKNAAFDDYRTLISLF